MPSPNQHIILYLPQLEKREIRMSCRAWLRSGITFFLSFFFFVEWINKNSFSAPVLFIYLFVYFIILYWFCHTLTWIHHGCICVPHPELHPPSPSPSHPSGSSQCTSPEYHVSCNEPGLVICFTYDNLHFNDILPYHPTLVLSHRVQKTILYICVSFAISHIGLALPSF